MNALGPETIGRSLRRSRGPAPGAARPAVGPERDGRPDGRLRVLVAVPTTNQMYSGIGRAIVELCRRLRDRAAFTFALDDRDPRSLRRLWEFAAMHRMPIRVGPHRLDPDCVDPTNLDLPAVIRGGDWDAIELVGFANAAVGRDVLEHLDDRTALCYTPHDQPLWTVPMSEAQRVNVAEVHRRVLRRADLVLADSPAEARQLEASGASTFHCLSLPLGCDFDAFDLGPPDRLPQLLFVGDLAEIRKRFDRVVAVFEHVLRSRPDYRLVVIGNRSDSSTDRIPAAIRHAVDLRGYVAEADLRASYGSCRALLLLSDVEAFGLPILEALACGTPVVLGRLETTAGLFGDCPGAHFCPLDDPAGTLAVVDRLLGDWRTAVAAARADRPRLRSAFGWDHLADRKWRALSEACALRGTSIGRRSADAAERS